VEEPIASIAASVVSVGASSAGRGTAGDPEARRVERALRDGQRCVERDLCRLGLGEREDRHVRVHDAGAYGLSVGVPTVEPDRRVGVDLCAAQPARQRGLCSALPPAQIDLAEDPLARVGVERVHRVDQRQLLVRDASRLPPQWTRPEHVPPFDVLDDLST